MKLDVGIFLDFDGVLFDTVKEAYVTCLFCTGKVNTYSEVDYKSNEFKIFKKYRYLITKAWNYFYLLKIIDSADYNKKAGVENKYLAYIAKAQSLEYKEFEQKFLEAREYLKAKHEEFWLTLNIPYSFLSNVSSFINKYPDNFFIVTTKDDDTVSKLLKANKQAFNIKNIYGRNYFYKFKTKKAVIRNIMKEYVIKKALFIDDSIFHVSECDSLDGLKNLQPKWGYVSPKSNTFKESEILLQIKDVLEGE